MSLARDWLEAALNADLTQNELKAFLAIFHQTLCYGKTTDALTLKRVAQIAQVRVDRITPALRAIADKALIEIEVHTIFGQKFSIPQRLLQHYPTGFSVPALPKNRKTLPENGSFQPEKRGAITTSTITSENPTTTPANTTTPPTPIDLSEQERSGSLSNKNKVSEKQVSTLPYPSQFDDTQRQRARELLDGLTPTDATDCLLILTKALDEPNKVRSPLGFLYQLAKAARCGSLDRSNLRSPTSTTDTVPIQPCSATRHMQQLQQLQARQQTIQIELQHIRKLYSLAQLPLPDIELQKCKHLEQEWHSLAAEIVHLLPTCTVEGRERV